MKNRVKISKIENRKTIERTNKNKSWLFENTKLVKLKNFLAKMKKKKIRRHK